MILQYFFLCFFNPLLFYLIKVFFINHLQFPLVSLPFICQDAAVNNFKLLFIKSKSIIPKHTFSVSTLHQNLLAILLPGCISTIAYCLALYIPFYIFIYYHDIYCLIKQIFSFYFSYDKIYKRGYFI